MRSLVRLLAWVRDQIDDHGAKTATEDAEGTLVADIPSSVEPVDGPTSGAATVALGNRVQDSGKVRANRLAVKTRRATAMAVRVKPDRDSFEERRRHGLSSESDRAEPAAVTSMEQGKYGVGHVTPFIPNALVAAVAVATVSTSWPGHDFGLTSHEFLNLRCPVTPRRRTT